MTKLSFGTGQCWFHLPGEREGGRGAACLAEEIKQLNYARLKLGELNQGAQPQCCLGFGAFKSRKKSGLGERGGRSREKGK